MPIYEYHCDCGNKFEDFRSMSNVSTVCSCGRTVRPKPSVFSGKVVGNLTVIDGEGRILSQKPYYGRTPMMNFENGREY